jgi:hypothetical protein
MYFLHPLILPLRQSPRCQGHNRDRFFFDPKSPIRDSLFFEVQMEGNNLVVKAGSVHGISDETEFVLYPRPDKDSAHLGYFAVQKVKGSTSILKPTESTSSISLPAYAVPTKVSRIALADTPGVKEVADSLKNEVVDATEAHLHQFLFVPKDQAAIEVDISEDGIVFNNLNPRLNQLGYSRMPFLVKKGETKIIRSILKAAGDFDRYLHHVPARSLLRDSIQVEFIKITRPADRQYGPAIQYGNGENLVKDDIIDIQAGDTLYGMKIINNHPSLQLYPHLFLFDCSELSIGTYHPIHLWSAATHLSFRVFLYASIGDRRRQGRTAPA